jgi:hypothetical protein
MIPFARIFNIGSNEKRICFRMNVFNHDLETIKRANFGDLDIVGEAFNNILVDNSIRVCEEREDMGNEMPFLMGQSYPIPIIMG